MKLPMAIILGCTMVLGSVALSAQNVSTDAPQTARSAQPRRQGFFDYALGKINPKDTDYGAVFETARAAVVSDSIDDLYFWSNVLSLVLLTVVTGALYFGWRSGAKKEVVAARIIAELWNGRVSDRVEIARRTELYNRLAGERNAHVERALMAAAEPSRNDGSDTSTLQDRLQSLDPLANREEVMSVTETGFAQTSTQSGNGPGLQKVTLLERQVEAYRNSERNLRTRLNEINRQLEIERKRNHNLKGAIGEHDAH